MSLRLVRHPENYTKCRPQGRHFAFQAINLPRGGVTMSPRRGDIFVAAPPIN